MKRTFWKADWFVGLVLLFAFLIAQSTSSLIENLDNRIYDFGLSMTSRPASDKIAIITIDQPSIDNIGRWPWSRDVHAKFLDKLATAKPKVIAETVVFTDPEQDRGAKLIADLRQMYAKLHPDSPGIATAPATTTSAAASVSDAEVSNPPAPVAAAAAGTDPFAKALDDASLQLDFDGQLASSIKQAGNVTLAMLVNKGEPRGNQDQETPAWVKRNSITTSGDPANGMPIPVDRLILPFDRIGQSAKAIGHLLTVPSNDGVVRIDPLAVRYYGEFYPSFSLAIAANYLNIPPSQIQLKLGKSVKLGELNLNTVADSTIYPYYYPINGEKSAFTTDSFFDVYTGKVPVEKYNGKIVLIGTTVAGVGSFFVTPASSVTHPVVLLANDISAILEQHYFTRPEWGDYLALGLLIVTALYLMFALPKVGAAAGAGMTALLMIALVGAELVMLSARMVWLPLVGPAIFLLLGHLALTTKHYLSTEKGKEQSELSAAESNRLLGLAFQTQGQLDMAFDKFRKVPMDDSVMDLLYNLALDFERKRQFNKAESVYQHMGAFNPKYRDLDQKLTRARQMSETVMLGGASGRSNASTLIMEGAVEKPMLGRYQVEKELGKGAMGVVYLGKDPKISRVVAIKTMALSQEFEADELEDARARFFREAETAGRLNHPNIVTIYDAGEEHDLCYIAMEFLKGRDLLPHTKVGHLLPIDEVTQIVINVADALDYAHSQSVVHRDIKPANIMYEHESHTVKVTDFGIARITDSSKTKTGMVLGTPSYMSPEQLAGRKIDGRSDLFSLGVMLYQMSAGVLPFVGESMAELMYRIANETYRDPREINPQIPDCVVGVIDHALMKNPDQRFQTGAEFAAALRSCRATFSGGVTA